MSMLKRHRIGSQTPGRQVAVALLSVLAMALVACGDDDGGGGNPPDARQNIDAGQGIDGGADIDGGGGIDGGGDIDGGAGIDGAPGAGFGYDVYLRGSFNSDGNDNPFTASGSTYTLTVNLTQGNHQFKITDDPATDERSWSVSATDQVAIDLDTPTPLVLAPGTGNETTLRVMPADVGDYTFTVDATDPAAPTLTVSQVVAVR
jgi:hypothetical protein